MANKQKGGLRPVSGGQNNIKVMRFYCDGSANSSAISIGDVVKADSGGGVVLSSAGAGVANVGVVVGTFDTNQIPNGHPMSANASYKYLPASTVGYVDVALALPDAIFIGQSALTSYALTDVFAVANIVATTVNTTTHHSAMTLGALSGADFRILGKRDGANNDWGAVYCDVYVCALASIFFGASTAV
jgi:hypothetical protein